MKDLRTVFLVGSGGFLGANARYWLGSWMQSRLGAAFPWQTLTINVSGSFIMGLFMGLMLTRNWSPDWRFFLAVGVLGGYTTFSAFSYEAVTLISDKSYAYAFWYIAGSAILSILGAWLGIVIARTIAGGTA
jgi:CrcB protein